MIRWLVLFLLNLLVTQIAFSQGSVTNQADTAVLSDIGLEAAQFSGGGLGASSGDSVDLNSLLSEQSIAALASSDPEVQAVLDVILSGSSSIVESFDSPISISINGGTAIEITPDNVAVAAQQLYELILSEFTGDSLNLELRFQGNDIGICIAPAESGGCGEESESSAIQTYSIIVASNEVAGIGSVFASVSYIIKVKVAQVKQNIEHTLTLFGNKEQASAAAAVSAVLGMVGAKPETIELGSKIVVDTGANSGDISQLAVHLEKLVEENKLSKRRLDKAIRTFNKLVKGSGVNIINKLFNNKAFRQINNVLKNIRKKL